MKKIFYMILSLIVFLALFQEYSYAQKHGHPVSRGVEPKEPPARGDPKTVDPFWKPDEEVDEPYVEDPEMTKMEMPFKEPELLFDYEVKGEYLERFYEKEPDNPLLFEPDLRFKDPFKEPEPLIVVPDERGINKCPKGLKCN